MFKNDFYLILGEVFLLFSILFLIVFFVIFDKIFKKIHNVLMITNCALIILFFLIKIYFNNFSYNYYLFNYLFVSNSVLFLFKIILIFTLIAYFFILTNIKNNLYILNFEYIIINLLICFGILFLLNSLDFLSFYVSLELISLGLYILAAYNKHSNLSVESSIKYFVLGAIASGILLLGILIIYGLTGLTNFFDISQLSLFLLNYSSNFFFKGIVLGFILVLFSLLFKMGIAPFHVWLPDVYRGSATISVAFFSLIPKLGIICIFINIFIQNLDLIFLLINTQLLIFVILSWFVGSLMALYQTNLKRLLGYSSVSHMGFILLSLILLNIKGIFFYKIIYLVLLINIFTVIIALEKLNKQEINNVFEFINMYKLNPILSINILFLLFSFAGIPPLMGFFGKWYVFSIAIIWNEYFFIVFLGLIFSVISSLYYLRILKIIFIENKLYFSNWKMQLNGSFLVSVTFYLNIIFFLNPTLLFYLMEWFLIV